MKVGERSSNRRFVGQFLRLLLHLSVIVARSSVVAVETDCVFVEDEYGPDGDVPIRVETVVDGLEVPWAIGFLPNGDFLVTERPGRIRIVSGGVLVDAPLARVPMVGAGEAGLLGLAVDRDFGRNRSVFLYYSAEKQRRRANRIEKWQLSEDHRSATPQQVLLDDIPYARFHDGGRLRIGPDGMLWAGTGDAGEPNRAQDRDALAGKILRIKTDGTIPADNPWAGNAAWILGVRNVEGFDWANDRLYVADHGPSGELGRRGHDEVSVATRGANLGWPTIWGCRAQDAMTSPSLTWRDPVPPGGAAFYTGTSIPEWRGSLLVASLGAEHLHRVVFASDHQRVSKHEVYLRGRYGRLRDVIMGPDGHLYLTTSNCDGRGRCPAGKDAVLRILR
jgi:glucose/arabinose dehydrogenase